MGIIKPDRTEPITLQQHHILFSIIKPPPPLITLRIFGFIPRFLEKKYMADLLTLPGTTSPTVISTFVYLIK